MFEPWYALVLLIFFSSVFGYHKGSNIGREGERLTWKAYRRPIAINLVLSLIVFILLGDRMNSLTILTGLGFVNSVGAFYIAAMIAGFQIGKRQHFKKLQIDHERSSKLKP